MADEKPPSVSTDDVMDDVSTQPAQHTTATSDPGATRSSTQTDETQHEKENQDGDETEAIDLVVGAGAQALQASTMMFSASPNGSDDISNTNGVMDVVTNENAEDDDDDDVMRDDEADVTHHDDIFEIDVRIRLVDERDESRVKRLIYDGIYVAALNRYLLTATERPFVIGAVGLLAVVFAFLIGRVFVSLFLSVVVAPFLLYIYVRYVALVLYKRRHLPDVHTGIYRYWSAGDSGRVMWVAEVDNSVVGTVAIETHSAIDVEMKHLSVDPAWQCLGIGGRLAQHALAHIRRRRFRRVSAHVLSLHSEAVMMYSKLGFRRTNVRTVWSGFCTMEDFALNYSVGSRANVQVEN